MKLSSEPDHPNYDRRLLPSHVFFNGYEHLWVFEADEDLGYVIVADLDSEGKLQVDLKWGTLKKIKKYGTVRIQPCVSLASPELENAQQREADML